MKRGVDEFAETVAIVPDTTANRDKANADTDVSEQIDRALHRIGDGEIGVFTLFKAPNEKNASEEADELHDCLNGDEVADNARAMKSTANRGRRSFVEDRCSGGTEEAHGAIMAELLRSVSKLQGCQYFAVVGSVT